jgi:riboflavin kinase/FMN adenylyltransferase
MIVYRGIDSIHRIPNAVLTAGTFDGVHKGHKAILNRLCEIARQVNGQSVVLTFDPHPRKVLSNDAAGLRLLNTLKEKEILLQKSGVQHLIIINFTKQFSEMESAEYVRKILVERIGVKKLVIGYDHRFGKGRGGSFAELSEMSGEFGFDVEEIPPQEIENVAISSTKIRNALAVGDVKTASVYLGYNYSITGKVEKGNQLGRKLNFPTANITPDDKMKLIPENGVYAVRIAMNGVLKNGMCNIGNRPTLGGNECRTIECHIFDFNQDIYGIELIVEFIEKLRDEVKFESLDALKTQLEADKLRSLDILSQSLDV